MFLISLFHTALFRLPSYLHSLWFFCHAHSVFCPHFHHQQCPVCAWVLHPSLALTWSLSTHTQFRTSVQTWGWIVPCTQGSQTLHLADTFLFSEHSALCRGWALWSCCHVPPPPAAVAGHQPFNVPFLRLKAPHPWPRLQSHQCLG